MKTTAEEKLLRSLERNITEGTAKRTRREFKQSAKESHKLAMDVIRKHTRMIGLWKAMDARIQARAKSILSTKQAWWGD